MLRLMSAAVAFQVDLTRRSPGHTLVLVTAPFFSVILLSLADLADRPDLVASAILGPGLIGLWLVALDLAGGMIGAERGNGTLELQITTPSPLAPVIFGRIIPVLAWGSLTFLESWLVARLVFGVSLEVAHPGVLALTAVVTIVAMAGTASLMAAVFTIGRSVLLFQNSLNYPFYILGGVVVPVEMLPDWLEPFTRLIFLSWASDLARAATNPAPIDGWPVSVAAIVGLGIAAFVGAAILTRRIEIKLRRDGTAGLA